jgi:hypothetical protein
MKNMNMELDLYMLFPTYIYDIELKNEYDILHCLPLLCSPGIRDKILIFNYLFTGSDKIMCIEWELNDETFLLDL